MTFTTDELLVSIWLSTESWIVKEQWLNNLRNFRNNDLQPSEWEALQKIIHYYKKDEFRKIYYSL